jgi:acylphosphatase
VTEKAVRVQITGLVQGVFFRVSARDEALRLGVHGWVRNRRDGSVEALYQGAPDAVERMIAWSRQGPRGARVKWVDAQDVEPDPRFEKGFSVLKELPG